jgi:hypothetical protein
VAGAADVGVNEELLAVVDAMQRRFGTLTITRLRVPGVSGWACDMRVPSLPPRVMLPLYPWTEGATVTIEAQEVPRGT